MQRTTATTFARFVIRGLSRHLRDGSIHPDFTDCPMLEPALFFASAAAYEKYLKGRIALNGSPGMFVNAALGIARNQVLGPSDLIPAECLVATPALTRAYEDALTASFERHGRVGR